MCTRATEQHFHVDLLHEELLQCDDSPVYHIQPTATAGNPDQDSMAWAQNYIASFDKVAFQPGTDGQCYLELLQEEGIGAQSP